MNVNAYRLAAALTSTASRSKTDRVELVFDGRELRIQLGDDDRAAIAVPYIPRRIP